MEQYKQPLLSICIPTYNRAYYLEDALINITSNHAFNSNVEIIISDNASTDNTQEIGEKYSQLYKNISYYRNSENIRDKNFILALKRSTGKYARLFNDTLRLQKGALEEMLNIIQKSSEDTPLFFYENISFFKNKHIQTIDGVESFLSNTSFWSTWIANFGNWRTVIDNIQNPNECASLLLTQVDWNFKIMTQYKKGIIYYNNYFTSVTPSQKGGYNIFDIFITNYLSIIRKYISKQHIIRKEKYYLFHYFLKSWIYTLSQNKDKFSFETKSMWRTLLKEYKYSPYFYIDLLLIKIKKSTNKK